MLVNVRMHETANSSRPAEPCCRQCVPQSVLRKATPHEEASPPGQRPRDRVRQGLVDPPATRRPEVSGRRRRRANSRAHCGRGWNRRTASAPASVRSAPSAALSLSTPRTASQSISRATPEARSMPARCVPRAPARWACCCRKSASTRCFTARPMPASWETRPLDWAMERVAQRVQADARRDLRRNAARRHRCQSHAGHRLTGRCHAGQRRELPDQEALRRRPWAWSTSKIRPASDTPRRYPVWGRHSAAARQPCPCGTWAMPTAS